MKKDQPKNYFNKNPTNQESKDTQSYSVNTKITSYQKQPQNNQANINQKMTKNIIQTLKRIDSMNKINTNPQNIKPTQKTLFAILTALLNSFDHAFQESHLSIEMIPQLFKVLGYPSLVNKTYFQPVGAPHTWGQCLAMMDWLADLASFHIDIKTHLQEGEFEQDLTTVLIKAVFQKDQSVARTYLEQAIMKKKKKLQETKYLINTINLQIQNEKAVQKDLKELEEDERKLIAILNRQDQECIQINQQNKQIEKKIKQLKTQSEQKQRIKQMHDQQISSLYGEIQNQELSVEDVQRIKLQIKQTQDKILQLKRFQQRQKQGLDAKDSEILNQYIDLSKTFQGIRNVHRKYKSEIEKKNIYVHIPEYNLQEFTKFLKNRSQPVTQVKIQDMLGSNLIKDMKQKSELLINKIDRQLIQIDEEGTIIRTQNKSMNEQIITRQLKNYQYQTQKNQLKTKLQNLYSANGQIFAQNKKLQTEITNIQNEYNCIDCQNDQIIFQMNQKIQQIKQLNQVQIKFQQQAKQIITKMKRQLEDHKLATLQMLQQEYYLMEQSVDALYGDQFQVADQINQQEYFVKQQIIIGNTQSQIQQKPELKKSKTNQSMENKNQAQQIEIPRCQKQTDMDEFDYESMFGLGSFESPKNDRIRRRY